MIKGTFTLILAVVSVLSLAQTIHIKGTVVDLKERPVPYANIGIAAKGVGTSSNAYGQFNLQLGEEFINDTVSISSIGYKTSAITVRKLLQNKDSITVYLSEHHVVMKEVTVKALDENAKHIVEKALRNYYSNYTTKKYQLEAFYRELIRNDETYVLLTEAYATIDDKGYQKRGDKRVRLDALRKSNDMRTMDSLDIHYDTLIEGNDLIGVINKDYIDCSRESWSFSWWPNFSNKMPNSFEFMLDSLAYFDGHLVYCISAFDKRYGIPSSVYVDENNLFIRTNDYALAEMRFAIKARELSSTVAGEKGNSGRLVEDSYYQKGVVQYQEYRGKWYPKYISFHSNVIGGDRQKASRLAFEEARQQGSSDLNYTEQTYNGRKLDPDKNNYFAFRELLVTSIKDKNDKYSRIKARDTLDSKLYTRNHKMDYNPDFWKGKSTLPMNPFLKQAEKDLQKSEELEEQFLVNGSED